MVTHVSAFPAIEQLPLQKAVTHTTQLAGVFNACGFASAVMIIRDKGYSGDISVAAWSRRVDPEQNGTLPRELGAMLMVYDLVPVYGRDCAYPFIELVEYARLPDAFKMERYRGKSFPHWIVRVSDTEYFDPLAPQGQGGPFRVDARVLDAAIDYSQGGVNARVGATPAAAATAPPAPAIAAGRAYVVAAQANTYATAHDGVRNGYFDAGDGPVEVVRVGGGRAMFYVAVPGTKTICGALWVDTNKLTVAATRALAGGPGQTVRTLNKPVAFILIGVAVGIVLAAVVNHFF